MNNTMSNGPVHEVSGRSNTVPGDNSAKARETSSFPRFTEPTVKQPGPRTRPSRLGIRQASSHR